MCLGNLKQLGLAWTMYADENDSRIVNGAGGMDFTGANGRKEVAWVGQCWASDYGTGGQMAVAVQRTNIQKGSLWLHVKEIGLYSCPTGTRGEPVTYAALDGVNGNNGRTGVSTGGNHVDAVGTRVGKTVLWLKKTTDIASPGLADRMVYIDEGWVTPDSFAVHYQSGQWWDDPPVRHGDGVNIAMADGHADYWKWTGNDTIKEGRKREQGHPSSNYSSKSNEGVDDLTRIQKACWRRIGYNPPAF